MRKCRACGLNRELSQLLEVAGRFFVCRPSLWDEDKERGILGYRPFEVPCFRLVTCEASRHSISSAGA